MSRSMSQSRHAQGRHYKLTDCHLGVPTRQRYVSGQLADCLAYFNPSPPTASSLDEWINEVSRESFGEG